MHPGRRDRSMTDDWATGPWMARFREALLESYDDQAFQMLTSDFFFPDTFSSLSPPTPGTGLAWRLYQYIDQARMQGFLVDLVRAAAERRPTNDQLRQLADELGLTS